MPYKLICLAPGSYDVFLDESGRLNFFSPAISEWPPPFKRLEHTARAWLRDAEIAAAPPDRRWLPEEGGAGFTATSTSKLVRRCSGL